MITDYNDNTNVHKCWQNTCIYVHLTYIGNYKAVQLLVVYVVNFITYEME